MSYFEAIIAARPGAQFAIINNDPATFEWMEDSPKPSAEDLEQYLEDFNNGAAALERAKASALAQIVRNSEAAFAVVSAEYSEGEQKTWRKQEDQARAFVADPTAPTPFIDKLLTSKPEVDKTAFCTNIVAKADLLEDLTATITAQTKDARDAVKAALNPAQVDEVDLSIVVPGS